MSWASSIEYYRFINQEVNRRLGGQHNAKNLMLTVDFAEIESLQVSGDWDNWAKLWPMPPATRARRRRLRSDLREHYASLRAADRICREDPTHPYR